MSTQKVPLTRIDETGASEGQGIIYTDGTLQFGLVAGSGGSGGSGFAAKNLILSTEQETVSARTQYNVFGGLELQKNASVTIALSGDLILDAPDDPNKAAGWTNSGRNIHITDRLDKVGIGTSSPTSKLTVVGDVSAQGNVYGNNVTNTGVILQVHEFHTTDYVTVSNTTQDLYETSITTKGANSDILVMFNTAHSTTENSVDVDIAMAMGWKVGAASTDPFDYTSLHEVIPGVTSTWPRQNVDNLGAFWVQDTRRGSDYGIWAVLFNKKHSPAQPAGTVLSYASFGSTDDTFQVGTAHGVPGNTGMNTSIILMEIAQ